MTQNTVKPYFENDRGIDMDELQDLKARLETQRPADWESLPDLALYMDQVIGYMARQLIRCDGEDRLTSAMVNNYIKDGHLPRAEGKRYSKAHLAYLTELCALKTVLSVREAGFLVNHAGESDVQARYSEFQAALDTALKDTARRLPDHCQESDLQALALELALRSYADKLACQRIIQLLRGEEPQEGKKSKKERKEAKRHE